MCQCDEVIPDSRFKNSVYCEIQRDLSGGDRLNQYCVDSIGSDLNVTDVPLYVKVLHSSSNGGGFPQNVSWLSITGETQ